MFPLKQLVDKINSASYKLELTGVVALLGGDYAVSALETIHLYKWRDRMGWYNYPGMLTVARTFGQIADSRLWDSLFPGPNGETEKVFGLEGKEGPEYVAAISGTKLSKTGHLAYLLSQGSGGRESRKLALTRRNGEPARKSKPATVTIVRLPEPDPDLKPLVQQRGPRYALIAFVPSFISVIAILLCLLAGDAKCAMLISTGILNSGISSLLLGSAELRFDFPNTSKGAPSGEGVMRPNEVDLIVLKGSERAVAAITRGRFSLRFTMTVGNGQKHHAIGFSSLLLMVQSLAQLLLISLSTFFGQLMYLLSFLASGTYHLYIASHGNDAVQRELLFRQVKPRIETVELGTRTQIAVFICLTLVDGLENQTGQKLKYEEILKLVIPNDTEVWKVWKKRVIAQLQEWHSVPLQQLLQNLEPSSSEIQSFGDKDKELYNDLMNDAWCVFAGYLTEFRAKSILWESSNSAEQGDKDSLIDPGSQV